MPGNNGRNNRETRSAVNGRKDTKSGRDLRPCISAEAAGSGASSDEAPACLLACLLGFLASLPAYLLTGCSIRRPPGTNKLVPPRILIYT